MRKLKKVFSLTLVCALICSMFCAPASASGYVGVEDKGAVIGEESNGYSHEAVLKFDQSLIDIVNDENFGSIFLVPIGTTVLKESTYDGRSAYDVMLGGICHPDGTDFTYQEFFAAAGKYSPVSAPFKITTDNYYRITVLGGTPEDIEHWITFTVKGVADSGTTTPTQPEQPSQPTIPTTPNEPTVSQGPGRAIPANGTYKSGQFGLGSGSDRSVRLITISNCLPRKDFSTVNVYDQNGTKIKTNSSYFTNAAYGCLVDEVRAGFYPNYSDSIDLILCKATFPRQYEVDIETSSQTITLTGGDSLNGPVKGYNTLCLKYELGNGYYSYYFFYLERQDETPEFAQTQPTTPTQPEQPTTPSQPQQPSQESNGMARSDRGIPLNRRADGNYDLVWVDGGVIIDGATGKVKTDTRKIKVTTYSPEFKELSVREIPIELNESEIGNVYFGQDYNFFIFGQENREEDNNKEVLRVVKYSKDWQRLGAAALRDANTVDIFGQHGNRSFAEANGMLYIHSGHVIYKLPDGLNHQTNMTIAIRESDMVVTDKRVAVSNTSTGYVSHSMANDILVDREGRIVTLDTGDGHPRGAMLFRYAKRAGGDKFQGGGDVNIFATWPGAYGDVHPGAATQALAETSQGYLSAYSDSGKGSSYNYTKDSCSLYLAFTPKNNFNEESTIIRRVDDHPNGDSESVLNSYLVPASSEGGYLLWYTRAKIDQGYYGDYTLYYATYQADGTVGTTRKLENVPMPYNGPINVDGKVVWTGATSDKEGLRFCVLDQNGAKVSYATGELSKGGGSGNPTTPKSFADVKSSDWFKPYVEKAAEAGLINGVGNGKYKPLGDLTLAQAVVLAYQIDSKATGRTLPQTSGPWYMPYYQYCLDNGIITASQVKQSDLSRAATRFEMVHVLDRAIPASRMAPVKTVASIPDVPKEGNEMIYKWYEAGIISGNSKGRFNGNKNITRAEVAVILCQINNLV